jgi:hypothetical protein
MYRALIITIILCVSAGAADIWMNVETAVTVPVNIFPLVDATDHLTLEEAIAYNTAGLDLDWIFVTSAGVITKTDVTPTTGGDYDWSHVGSGIYKIEIPASGGASINNDANGVGWFVGDCDATDPWRGPTIEFTHGVNVYTVRDTAPIEQDDVPSYDDVAAVQTVVDDIQTQIGTAGDGLTAVVWNADWDAEVQSEADDAIVANYLDYLLKTTYDPASKPGSADALFNEIVENDGGVSRFTANALENGPSGEGGITVTSFSGDALVKIMHGGFSR